LIPALAGIAFVLVASEANGQQPSTTLGARHQVVISAEHLAGFARTTASGRSDAEIDLWLFGSNRQNPGLAVSSPYSSPRAAVDFFVAERWSVGMSLSLSALSYPNSRQVVLAPRLGAALPLSPRWNLWGRVGFTYLRQNDDFGTTRMETTLYAITLEAPFVATIGGNFFLSVAPTANVGVGGSSNLVVQPPNGGFGTRSAKQTELGVQAGLGGFF
jgi:hypothetical protein